MKSKIENKIYSIITGVCQQQAMATCAIREKGRMVDTSENLITAQTPYISNQCNTYY
jgi:hypothetical protein